MEKPKKKILKRTISANGGFGPIHMVSDAEDNLSMRRLSSEGDRHKGVSARTLGLGGGLGGPISIEEGNKCQQDRWSNASPEGGGL